VNAGWRYELSPRAARDRAGLPPDVQARIDEALDRLVADIRACDVRKLQGQTGAYRLRVGTYRVLFAVDPATRTYLIARIDHRRDAYR
jgi:mRNA interferase RelE/StbE